MMPLLQERCSMIPILLFMVLSGPAAASCPEAVIRGELGRLVQDGRLPAAAGLGSFDCQAGACRLLLSGAEGRYEDADVEEIQLSLMNACGLKSLWVGAGEETGRARPLVDFLPKLPPVPKKVYECAAVNLLPLVVPVGGASVGFLNGKSVYLSQSHGFTWSQTLNRWATQRGNTNGIVEDFLNAEAINQYLVYYLENAGAQVFTVRERDLNPEMVIVDNDGGAAGGYEEVGQGFSMAADAGFGDLGQYDNGQNPMSAGSARVCSTQPAGATFARWTPVIPVAGFYSVSVTYSAGPNRVAEAHYVIHHAGGDAEFLVNQRSHGGTWIYLGTFYFSAGANPEKGSLVLLTDSKLDGTVSADAAKFGGGRGLVRRGAGSGLTNSPTSGRPRWEESCRYAAQFNGAPPEVYDASTTDGNDDVGARSRYTAWQHEEGEDAVYVSWHTNAPNPARGTSTYVYGPNEPNGSYQFTGIKNSDKLATLLHHQIVADIRAAYDPGWQDRGIMSAWFGELNPEYNPEVPGALVEVGFHDTEADCLKMQDPKFRNLVARAMYKAVVSFFAWKDGSSPVFLPEPPHAFQAQIVKDSLVLSWFPSVQDAAGVLGDAPETYLLHRSLDGLAFDGGEELPQGEEVWLPVEAGQAPLFLQLRACNAGGCSMGTPVLAAEPSQWGQPQVLLVGAFETLNRSELLSEDLSAWSLGTVRRMHLGRMNTYSYLRFAAGALHELGLGYDSAWSDSGIDGQLLSRHRVVFWMAGEEAPEDRAFSLEQLKQLSAFVGGGGLLVASGADLALGAQVAGGEYLDSFKALFGAELELDEAGSSVLVVEGLDSFDASCATAAGYDLDSVDSLSALDGEVVVRFENGKVAAVVRRDGDGAALLLTVPFECIAGADRRAELLSWMLDELGFVDEPLPEPELSGADGGQWPDFNAEEAVQDAAGEVHEAVDAVSDAGTPADVVLDAATDGSPAPDELAVSEVCSMEAGTDGDTGASTKHGSGGSSFCSYSNAGFKDESWLLPALLLTVLLSAVRRRKLNPRA